MTRFKSSVTGSVIVTEAQRRGRTSFQEERKRDDSVSTDTLRSRLCRRKGTCVDKARKGIPSRGKDSDKGRGE